MQHIQYRVLRSDIFEIRMATVFTQTALTMDTIDEILLTSQLEKKNSMSNLQVTSHLERNLSQNSANSILCQPFNLQYPLTNSLN